MYNTRTIFASLSLFLVLGLIYEWNSGSKTTKLERSVLVQNSAGLSGHEMISNNNLDLYIDTADGSIKEAFLYEKERDDGLVKTRLMSNDDLLKFYFKTSISGFRNSAPFEVKSKTSSSIVLGLYIFKKILKAAFETFNELVKSYQIIYGLFSLCF